MIYLDNAATTKPAKAAVDALTKAAECFGNPSSLHGFGIVAEKLINESKKNIADMLGVESKNILFTSGGTEANNLAVFGVAAARHKIGTKIVTSKIEHPSVLEAFRKLEFDGEIVWLLLKTKYRFWSLIQSRQQFLIPLMKILV